MFDDATAERFFSKVDKNGPNGCWIWIGPRRPIKDTGKPGYGRFYTSGKAISCHKYSYQLLKGSIPSGLVLDHLCRVQECVNPDHLEAVTNKENIMRGAGASAVNSQKTHCKHGHPLTGKNLFMRTRMYDGGWVSVTRVCKTCRQARKNARQRRASEKRRMGK
ncbi:HNH endonuclease signature motif containing protein [Sphingobium sp. YC-XJ3]|uniref:HNH endonuclease signature motif containing protein n=1 Tax=Sphingobium sp. YC-XJ3 TaxID=3024245 RepID=UPI00235E401C|nr:HNH endonuclease signature motif containing protein [Sphingobium sp. YC-XJ3]WDA36444.1 HNH endonuclease signature motif containing protein [Sphingobium sp. YC-XJ3]